METLEYEVISHPPYCPDLAPSDFRFFPQLKRYFKGNYFTSDDEVKHAVRLWIKERTPEFFIAGMRKLVLCWEKFIERQGNYVEK
jgi:histone-lysine N-methyltransferase SETMAR